MTGDAGREGPPDEVATALAGLLAACGPKALIRPGLSRTRTWLAALGHPDPDLDFIHIAGTNGKGSTLAFLEAILGRSGLIVGMYTSPHLERFQERIRLDGRPVAEEVLVRHLGRMSALRPGEATCFELLTVLALEVYADMPWSVVGGFRARPVLMETGLGGRWDATNVIRPRVALIASIGLDHQEWLGSTVTEIAREKAGIIKPGVPVIADPGDPEAEAVILREAARKGAPLYLYGRDYQVERLEGGAWRFQDREGSWRLPRPVLAGGHQYRNAALAVAGVRCLRAQGWPVDEAATRKGLTEAFWPGRLEWLGGDGPEGRAGDRVVLDGAHNPAAVEALVVALRAAGEVPFGLVFAVFGDKAVAEMVALLAPVTARVWLPLMAHQRAAPPEELAARFRYHGVEAAVAASPEAALREARRVCPPTGRIVVTGSLHLVGSLRTALMQPPPSGPGLVATVPTHEGGRGSCRN